jgi:hypothetical protein
VQGREGGREWTQGLVALRRFKEEAVLAHVVRSPPTLSPLSEWTPGVSPA